MLLNNHGRMPRKLTNIKTETHYQNWRQTEGKRQRREFYSWSRWKFGAQNHFIDEHIQEISQLYYFDDAKETKGCLLDDNCLPNGVAFRRTQMIVKKFMSVRFFWRTSTTSGSFLSRVFNLPLSLLFVFLSLLGVEQLFLYISKLS